MAASDAIEVVEDWISEHYFTSDARNESFQSEVLKRRKTWDDDEGGGGTPRSRFTKLRPTLSVRLPALTNDDDRQPVATPTDDITALYDSIRAMLGFDPHELQVTTQTGVRRYATPGVSTNAPLAIVDATPVATHEDLFDKGASTLLRPYVVDDTTQFTSLSRLVSHLFLAEDGPELALVLAGRWAVIGERSRWAEGRYLAINLQAICDRNDTKRGGEVDRALTCLAAESLVPDADGAVWWSRILGDSVQHTVGVSKDLREGVRLSIEIIANEVVARRVLQELPPLSRELAQPLAKQSLRFLYRILFLLFAEASPELAVLPADAPEYESGYSLTRLRELTLVEISDPRSQQGTHLYDSLGLLFHLVDQGHTAPKVTNPDGSTSTDGLDFQPLRADLFRPEAVDLIDEVKLGNAALQKVLRHLFLSKESKGRDRGFISYVELGINQLGAVYEGLMSYTGSFAETDLYEVARNGDPSKGSWVVPIERATGIAEADFVRSPDPITGESKPVLHERGSFVFRLSGRQRQQSASYYTPEVLTRFTVGQALEELLDQDGHVTAAEEILNLTICEPALGSGAFAIEAVRQLATQYLVRRQQELQETIPPEEYPRELQRVKAFIALHQVYGVDLNATAVEFAEIALWLDTMSAGLEAPWFGLHLRRGNSLIGARRAVYTRDQVNSKQWLDTPPTDVPLTDLAQRIAEDDFRQTDASGRIPHWLLPARGWGATSEAKEAKDLAPERAKRIRDWRRSVVGKLSKPQVDALTEIGYQAEELWRMAYRRLVVAEQQSRRAIPLWKRELEQDSATVSREQIEASLQDADGAYQRLRRVMDAWCALWFWPLASDETPPPTLAQWIDACQQILGKDARARKAAQRGAATLAPDDAWQALAEQEDLAIKGAGGRPVAEVLNAHPWLRVCEKTSQEQGFFHWQLDMATVFGRGGFHLQLGNPPWVRPDVELPALLADFDPWWGLAANPSQDERTLKLQIALSNPTAVSSLVNDTAKTAATASYLASSTVYPELIGFQTDFYRCFIIQAWRHLSPSAIAGLVHPEGNLTDSSDGVLRRLTYQHLKRHWQFQNQLKLFEIGNTRTYGVYVYSGVNESISFMNACGLYHPETVERSLRHDGSGDEPGFRDQKGGWDLRPHLGRIQTITAPTIAAWGKLLDLKTLDAASPMVYTVNGAALQVAQKLSARSRIDLLGLQFSSGLNETSAIRDGTIERRWGTPESWDEVILQGPHLDIANPRYQTPNKTMSSHRDWSATDLENLSSDRLPATSFKRVASARDYDDSYTSWGIKSPISARNFFRLAWRRRVDPGGSRTLISAIIPPGAAHVHLVNSAGNAPGGSEHLALAAAFSSSLLADFMIRLVPRGDIFPPTIRRLPIVVDHPLQPELILRILRLNCLTEVYAELWDELFSLTARSGSWTLLEHRGARLPLDRLDPTWTESTPLTGALDRRDAQVEIDAAIALTLGVTSDELCTIYRTEFAILHGYDHDVLYYDAEGKLIPNTVLTGWRRKGDGISESERTYTKASGRTYTYTLPFRTFDREEDMRTAYAEFERRLQARS